MSEMIGLAALTLTAGCATTYVWRFAGVYLAERTDPHSEILRWVRAVATALVAALVARIIFSPPELLGVAALEARLAAMALGVAGFYVFRKHTGAGVAIAVAGLLVSSWLSAA